MRASLLRSTIKTAAASVLHSTRADKLARASFRDGRPPLVIAYHRVVEDFAASRRTSLPAMLISTRMLERHIEWLARRFDLVSLDELARRIETGASGARPPAAITFDDGYRDVYDNAFPLLRRKGIPASVFVVTSRVGTDQACTHDVLYLLLERAFATWPDPRLGLARILEELSLPENRLVKLSCLAGGAVDATRKIVEELSGEQIRHLIQALDREFQIAPEELASHRALDWPMLSEMLRAGFTIGSHTRSHANLPNEDHEIVIREMLGSRIDLEKELSIEIAHFAYPCGAFDPVSVRAAASSGYRFAYTICRHRDPAFPDMTIPRRVFWENTCLDVFGRFSPSLMSCQINGVFDFRLRCRHDPGHSHRAQAPGALGAAPSASPPRSAVRSRP